MVRGSLLEPRRRYEYGELDPMKNRIFVKNQNDQFIETSFHLCTLWRVFKLMYWKIVTMSQSDQGSVRDNQSDRSGINLKIRLCPKHSLSRLIKVKLAVRHSLLSWDFQIDDARKRWLAEIGFNINLKILVSHLRVHQKAKNSRIRDLGQSKNYKL